MREQLTDSNTPKNQSGGWSKLAIGLVAAAGVAAVAVAVFLLTPRDDSNQEGASPAPTESPPEAADSEEQDPGGTDKETPSFSASATGRVINQLAPQYGEEGDAAVRCIEQNTVGGFTEEELEIIYNDPTATSWPPGLGEKFAAVLEECIPLRPWYLLEFGMYNFIDPDCVETMTDHVLARYNWAEFIRKGVMGPDEAYDRLQDEFDNHVNAGYEANGCYVEP